MSRRGESKWIRWVGVVAGVLVVVLGVFAVVMLPDMQRWSREGEVIAHFEGLGVRVAVVDDGPIWYRWLAGKLGLPEARAISAINSGANNHLADEELADIRLTSGRLMQLAFFHPEFGDEGMKYVGEVEGLWHLSMMRNRVTGAGLAAIAGLRELQLLDLWDVRVGDEDMKHLLGMTALNHLELRGTDVTDAGVEVLVGISSLRNLSLRETAVTDGAVEWLAELKKLRNLDVVGTGMSEAGVERLKGLLPGLEVRGP